MKGTMDEAGRALLTLTARSSNKENTCDLTVWVDTAIDGELVVSTETIRELRLGQSAGVRATLADGSEVILETFLCEIDWFGQWRAIEVIANEGRLPLLGIGLLKGRKLTADYQSNALSLE